MFDHSITRELVALSSALLFIGFLALGCGEDAPTDPDVKAYDRDQPEASRAGAVGQQDPEVRRRILALRQATARFHDPEKAMAAGWTDRFPSHCLTHSDLGAMGFHLLNPDLVGDGEVAVTRPELLVYEPGRNDKLRLVAVEYAVLTTVQDGQPTTSPPAPLFGDKEFTLFAVEGVTVWQHHVWLWRDNPSGIFQDWNPKADCDAADPGDVQTFSDS